MAVALVANGINGSRNVWQPKAKAAVFWFAAVLVGILTEAG